MSDDRARDPATDLTELATLFAPDELARLLRLAARAARSRAAGEPPAWSPAEQAEIAWLAAVHDERVRARGAEHGGQTP